MRREPERRRKTASQAFRELVVEPMTRIEAGSLIVVDSLDETARSPGESIVNLIRLHARDLPSRLRFVATTRPEEPILQALQALDPFVLKADEPRNLEDVGDFCRLRAGRGRLADGLAEAAVAEDDFARRVEDIAEGNFMVARFVLDAVERGQMRPDDVQALSGGLAGFYHGVFSAMFPDVEQFRERHRPLLAVLNAAQAPLPREMLAGVLGIDELEARDRLSELSQLLRRRDGGNALFHQSLADWLSDEGTSGAYWTAADDGHAILAEALWQRHRDGDLGDYGLRHTVAHLVAAEQWDHLESILTDLSFLEAKTGAGLVFDLAADLTAGHASLPAERPQARILRLLDQALRADLHFLARHPSTLFQCLWNRAWWYDCDEAANHSDPAEGGWGRRDPPWERDEPRLCTLVERWRDEKEAREPGFPWVRSLRPPPAALGGAQIACLGGHEDWVNSVTMSPDGRRIVSGSYDDTVRVWDAEGGEELACLGGHERPVYSVTVSPDGRRIVSRSFRETRVWDAETFECLEVIEGHGDVEAIAGRAGEYPFRALRGGLETTIGDAATGREVAWFPITLREIATDPSARTWAGGSGSYLAIIMLEGEP